ncbi:hypothetical protein GCM10008955_24490 [Deinococcus malanensis]|uniref:VWFA domain-containing protein n=1 Tax=Deinococcus malanensis TaxID=1706855 RepID=A0ABQ2F0E7_9DEIO|nr:hypothetical protein GCM10008955_24490 [Deinococcus malanensis]
MAVVAFDHRVEVVAPLQEVKDLAQLESLIDTLQVGGSTNLFGGWQTASRLLLYGAEQGRLSRIVLVTDGRANVGLREPLIIGEHVAQAQTQGVSTSTVGVGVRYDENLLETLAGTGDGNYHFAERPDELEDTLQTELASLKATLGRRVSLGLRGVKVKDALNDFGRVHSGRLALPPLRAGRTLDLVFRLIVSDEQKLALRLAWDDATGERHSEHVMHTFLAVPQGFNELEQAEVVRVREGLLAARAQRTAAQLADIGDLSGALLALSSIRNRLQVESLRSAISLTSELHQLGEVERRLRQNNRSAASKLARKQSYAKQSGREG